MVLSENTTPVNRVVCHKEEYCAVKADFYKIIGKIKTRKILLLFIICATTSSS